MRLTAFTSSSQPLLLVRDWWNAITGGPPASIHEEPRAGVVSLQGRYRDAPLAMRAEADRVDLVRPFTLEPDPGLPPLSEALPAFADLVNRWIRGDDSLLCQRLGLGATVLQAHQDIEACRAAMDGYLSAVDMHAIEIGGLGEFAFQVNRRCSSQIIPDLSVNRIAKWAFRLDPAAVHLEMDLNSPPEHIDKIERPGELFREFAILTEEYVAKGDHQ